MASLPPIDIHLCFCVCKTLDFWGRINVNAFGALFAVLPVMPTVSHYLLLICSCVFTCCDCLPARGCAVCVQSALNQLVVTIKWCSAGERYAFTILITIMIILKLVERTDLQIFDSAMNALVIFNYLFISLSLSLFPYFSLAHSLSLSPSLSLFSLQYNISFCNRQIISFLQSSYGK